MPSDIVTHPASLAAIVVVGGASTRMGRPKPWLDFGGRPLLSHVVERVRPWVSEVVLVAAPHQELPPLAGDVTVVRDAMPGEGPLPALALGLGTITTSWALALACDAPAIREGVVVSLAGMRADDVDAVIPLWRDRPQPLVAVYRRSLQPVLEAMVRGGERRLHAIAALPRVRLVGADVLGAVDPEGDSFRSVNTPEEYAAALAAFAPPR